MSFTSNEMSRRPASKLSGPGFRYGCAVFQKEFARRLWRQIWLDDLPGRAAQLSYYFLLSLFPLLICLSALLGYLFAAQAMLERRLLDHLGEVMPKAAFEIVRATADDLLRTRDGGVLSFGLLVALWLASSGMEAVIEGLNVAFQVREARPWWKRRLVALCLTAAVALLTGGAIGLTLAGGAVGRLLAGFMGLEYLWNPLWRTAQWIAVILFLLFAIAAVYLFGPNLMDRRRTQVILPGAAVALICWMAASVGLRLYLDNFSSFGRTYGSLGAVIALLLWLYVSGAALLLGAEVNSGIQERRVKTSHGRSGGA